ncbi:MAG: histidine kinase [Cyanobium sp. NAT70]|nr:histidine kinase [Cyanobium sp. NAT70]
MRNVLFGAGQRPLRRQLAITLSIIFGISILVSMLLFNLLFGVQARNLIDQRSQFFMDAMLAVRSYTSKSVNPIIAPLNEGPGVFRPEAVPSYSAQTVFAGLKAKPEYQNYSYREAALNPTNLRDKADSFETSIINQFRDDSSLKVVSGDRSTPLGSVHFVARPIKVGKESCLTCHSTPERAPASQLRAYGDTSGFGWSLNEIVGTQIVTVPQQAVLEAKDRSLAATAVLLAVIFVVVAVITNLVLGQLILRPMRKISLKADEASVTPATVTFEERNRSDEIGRLAKSFERMKQSLAISMQMLKDRQGR